MYIDLSFSFYHVLSLFAVWASQSHVVNISRFKIGFEFIKVHVDASYLPVVGTDKTWTKTKNEPTRHGHNGVFQLNGRLHTTKQTSLPCLSSKFWRSFAWAIDQFDPSSKIPRKGTFLCFVVIPHLNGIAMANIVVFPTIAQIFVLAPIKHINHYKDLQKFWKLENWHTKDFAIGRTFLEMFSVQYAFTGKMDSWKTSLRTWKIKFMEIPFSMVRSAQSKACIKVGLGFVRNERAYLLESSLQGISSNSFCGNETNC